MRCNGKLILDLVVAGKTVAVCQKCYGDWLDKRDKAVSTAFKLFFPETRGIKAQAKT